MGRLTFRHRMRKGTTITSSTSSLLEESAGHMSKVRYYQPLSISELNGNILLSLSSLSFLSSFKSFIDFFSNPPIVFPGPFPLGVPLVTGVEEGDCLQSLSVALDGANPIDRAVVTFRGVVGVGEGTAGDGTDIVWYDMYRQLLVELVSLGIGR
jgi:hypothetical protein